MKKKALILFVRDERDEALLKPLPRNHRGLGYAAINRSVVERLAPALEGIDLIISTSGPSTLSGVRLQQRGVGFGERITNTVNDAFALGYQQLIVVGNDCLTIEPADITAAFATLSAGALLVAAPARDGGAFLIGARPGFDAVGFADLPWQTSRLYTAFLSLPHASALPVVREDHDHWNGSHARAALNRLLGSPLQAPQNLTHYSSHILSSALRKALTRSFLPAPPRP